MQIKASQIFTDFKGSGILSEMRGLDCELRGIASIESCTSQDIVFVSGKKYLKLLKAKKPAAVICSLDLAQDIEEQGVKTLLLSSNVNLAQALLKQKYMEHNISDGGWPRIHPSAVVHESVKVPESAHIGPMAVIGKNTEIAERVVIGAGSVIEHEVVLGENTIIHPRVFIGHHCIIGKNVIIKPGAVIGSEGFGFAQDEKRKNHRIPQTGKVRIGDRVVIGALNAIDRAAYDETHIDEGVVMDNLCHIAHNCHIGADSIITACCAVAGSTKIGKRVIFSGQTGVLDHLNIADDTVLLHRAGVVQDIEQPGAYAGLPLQPLQSYIRSAKLLKDFPEIYKRFKKLESTVYEENNIEKNGKKH